MVISDFDADKVEVKNRLSDHQTVLISLPDAIELEEMPPRKVYHYGQANWQQMQNELDNINWICLQEGAVEDALDTFYSILENLIDKHVPCSVKEQCRTDLPWFTAKCRLAVQRKHAAEGFDQYNAVAKSCWKSIISIVVI